MDIKNRRFELRLTERELQALDKLTKKAGLDSRSKWIANQIKRSAQQKRVWK